MSAQVAVDGDPTCHLSGLLPALDVLAGRICRRRPVHDVKTEGQDRLARESKYGVIGAPLSEVVRQAVPYLLTECQGHVRLAELRVELRQKGTSIAHRNLEPSRACGPDGSA
jgi:hypothetical protein